MAKESLRLQDATVVVNQGTAEERTILDHVSLTVQEGDFVTVLGSNGAGKSTLFNVIAGTLPLTSGEVYLGSQRVTHLNEIERTKILARIFQDPKLGTAPRMTVAENLLLAQRRGKKRRLRDRGLTETRREQLRHLTQTMGNGLSDRLDVATGSLSGGQRQALSFLMATQVKPALLLLDEHTAALDPKTSAQLMALTDEHIRREQLTAMMITHNLADALEYGNRLLVLANGKVAHDLTGQAKADLTVADLLTYFERY